jgi:hypothetical protein
MRKSFRSLFFQLVLGRHDCCFVGIRIQKRFGEVMFPGAKLSLDQAALSVGGQGALGCGVLTEHSGYHFCVVSCCLDGHLDALSPTSHTDFAGIVYARRVCVFVRFDSSVYLCCKYFQFVCSRFLSPWLK